MSHRWSMSYCIPFSSAPKKIIDRNSEVDALYSDGEWISCSSCEAIPKVWEVSRTQVQYFRRWWSHSHKILMRWSSVFWVSLYICFCSFVEFNLETLSLFQSKRFFMEFLKNEDQNSEHFFNTCLVFKCNRWVSEEASLFNWVLPLGLLLVLGLFWKDSYKPTTTREVPFLSWSWFFAINVVFSIVFFKQHRSLRQFI